MKRSFARTSMSSINVLGLLSDQGPIGRSKEDGGEGGYGFWKEPYRAEHQYSYFPEAFIQKQANRQPASRGEKGGHAGAKHEVRISIHWGFSKACSVPRPNPLKRTRKNRKKLREVN